MRIVGALLIVAACGHSEKGASGPDTRTVAPDASNAAVPDETIACSDVADATIKMARATDIPPGTREVLIRHCTDDSWSEPFKRCTLTAPDIEEGQACLRDMTDEQWKALEADLTAMGWNLVRPPPE